MGIRSFGVKAQPKKLNLGTLGFRSFEMKRTVEPGTLGFQGFENLGHTGRSKHAKRKKKEKKILTQKLENLNMKTQEGIKSTNLVEENPRRTWQHGGGKLVDHSWETRKLECTNEL